MCRAMVAAYLVFNVCVVLVGSTLTRKLTTEFPCEANDNVVYSAAVGQDDAFHYVLSTIGVPTILVFHTPLESSPVINCTRLLSRNASLVEKSITFSRQPLYTFALMFTKLYEYNDINDTSSLTKASKNETDWRVYDLSQVDWDNVNDTSDIQLNLVEFRLSKNGTLNFHENGYLSFMLQLSNSTERGPELPHLEYTANSTYVDFSLNNVKATFPNSRFALEMTLVTSNKSTGKQTLTNYRSIDDEHSPGVFEVVDWVASEDLKAPGAYLQWKSVCYKEEDRSVQTSTGVAKYDLELTSATTNNSIAFAYFGQTLLTPGTLLIRATNVSFGLTKDFYASTNYSAWSFTVGYGYPPKEHISILIILVISVGLGLPVLLMLAGGIYICVKRRTASSGADLTSSYQQIN